MSGEHYQVFLSHRSEDKPFVRQLAVRLEQDRISFFLDEANLVPGTAWQVALENSLAASDSCAVIVSDRGLGPYHELEMRAALSQQIESNREFRLIPVLLPGAVQPTDRELPPFLKQLTWVVFQADPEKDGEAYRRLKCGILGDEPGFIPPTMASTPGDLAERKNVPRGLRCYEPEDHSFFLKLVPGPRDERGLPLVIRDWKRLIEQIDPDRTFRVAYWYGPSGCGKSSLVKAGLMPTLAEYVAAVHVEAAADEAETPVLRELRKTASQIPSELGLADAFKWLAAHPEALGGRKLLLILDQFEQWLHAARGQLEGELAAALGHCHGRHLQALLLVRDDFNVQVHRFMKLLGCDMREHFNYQLIDLFDPDFARQVLFEYGRAYGRLPDTSAELDDDQNKFLDRVVQDLTTAEGKVVSVQLALSAQMLEGQPWTPQTLREMGGSAGVGRAFLEEKFDKRSANAVCLIHRDAAIKVFEALLPEIGTDIKARKRSREDLLQASGYGQRPTDFSELMELLDSQLRIITPVAVEEGQFYQLTHDYLVQALRDWLTSKQRQTWRGRAILLLKARTAEWVRQPRTRLLPGPLEYPRIMAAVSLPTRRLKLPDRRLEPAERRMLRAATRWYGVVAAAILLVASLVGWWTWEVNGRSEAQRLVDELVKCDASEHRWLVEQKLPRYRRWAEGKLHRALSTSPGDELPEDERVRYGKRRADAAIALVRLDRPDKALDVFRWQERKDPEALTQFIHRAKGRGVTAGQLIGLLRQAVEREDTSVRYALLLALGEFKRQQVDNALSQPLVDQLKQDYATDPSSAVHSATGWLLCKWGETDAVRQVDQTPLPYDPNREWFVRKITYKDPSGEADYLTFVVFPPPPPPGEFEMGSAENELEAGSDETRHRQVLTRTFALCDREVTRAQFARFRESLGSSDEPPPDSDASHPETDVSWRSAVDFCRWLTQQTAPDDNDNEQEQCYFLPPGAKSGDEDNPPEWAFDSQRQGFRLPTEAEWEFACRAGTRTRFSFGTDTGLLARYAVFGRSFGDGAAPIARLRPNLRGLFDIHGNTWEYCHDRYGSYPVNPEPDYSGPKEGSCRVLRGGGWLYLAGYCRSAARVDVIDFLLLDFDGFRVCVGVSAARTRP